MSSDELLTPKPDFAESSDPTLADSSVKLTIPSLPIAPSTEHETIAVSFTEIHETPEIHDLLPDTSLDDDNSLNQATETITETIIDYAADDSLSAVTPQTEEQVTPLSAEVAQLKLEKAALENDIRALKAEKEQLLSQQTQDIQIAIANLVQDGLQSLEKRKQSLETTIEQLERKRDRIREEMRTTFAGVSQDLAIRVQGFKEYLVGSLQDLAAAAEQLDLVKEPETNWETKPSVAAPPESKTAIPFAVSKFEDQNRRIQETIDQYRTRPDYYGPPWQLRRTFEPIHAEQVRKWFQVQGGRGAVRTLGSRLQNILVAAAVISILNKIYGDRCRALILADSPERLGEWRRGLQDCLGISRSDFGPERGIVLFESPEAMVQKAERLEEDRLLPVVIIDESEEQINLSLLQFPLWLAFAPDLQPMSSYSY